VEIGPMTRSVGQYETLQVTQRRAGDLINVAAARCLVSRTQP